MGMRGRGRGRGRGYGEGRKVQTRRSTYGGVNIFHRGASFWFRTVARAPKRDVPPSTSPIASPSSFESCAKPLSSPVAGCPCAGSNARRVSRARRCSSEQAARTRAGPGCRARRPSEQAKEGGSSVEGVGLWVGTSTPKVVKALAPGALYCMGSLTKPVSLKVLARVDQSSERHACHTRKVSE
jgi:hypothetical protein